MRFQRQQATALTALVPTGLRSLTIDHLWIITMLWLIWLFLSLAPLPPNDLWWHMAAGRAMVQEGGLIYTNRWAYTLPSDAPYIYQSWLSEIVLYWLWSVGDVPLLALARTVAITASYGIVAWHAWRRCGHGKAVALALLLAILAGWSNWTLRPQTLALVPGAVFAVVLGEYLGKRASARWLVALPALMIAWVNIHGSFVLGAGLLGLAWLGALIDSTLGVRSEDGSAWRRVRLLTYCGVATLLAMIAQPLGLGIFGYLRQMLTNPPLQRWFVEWQPPRSDLSLLNPGFWFFALLLLLAALMALGPRRPSVTDILWYIGLAWLAIGGVRYVIWFALLLFPLLAEQLAALRTPSRSESRTERGVIWLGLLLAGVMIATLPWFTPVRYLGAGAERLFATAGRYRLLLGNTTPVAATELLAQQPIAGRFWADMSYTSYTIWRLPQQQVFADLRAELFPEAIWIDYFAIAQGDMHSLTTIDAWQITHLMLDRQAQRSLHQLLLKTPGWCERYSDPNTVIMARC
jgi:hypothetical protein